MSTATLNALLEKTSDYDKDERYMATNDLCNELQKDIKIDENMERRICAAVLKQLDDSSNDVQTIAVKCLGILLKKVQQAQVGEICDKLCTLILEGKDELRDIYSIGLKTLIADVPDEMGALVAERLSSRLLDGISQQRNSDIKQECLDNMTDLLRRFGHLVERDHDRIMDEVVEQQRHSKSVIRKKAAQCLGSLAVVSSEHLLNRLVELILSQIEPGSQSSADVRTLIQTIGTISRTVGYRLGRHLDRIVPLFLQFCGNPNDECQQTDQANELREHCFPALESFVLRCPREVSPHLGSIVQVSVAFMKYDPNYCYDEDDEVGGLDDDELEHEEFSEDEYAGSDDDDTSWKVRKSAVKVIAAVIAARPEMLQDIYNTCADELIARFREREENVRMDIISCFAALLNATLASSRARQESEESRRAPPESLQLARQRSSVSEVKERVPAIIRASQKQLLTNSQKSKSAIFAMLRTLCTVLNGGLAEHITSLIQNVKKCLDDRAQALKLDALSFLRVAVELHDPIVFQPHVASLLPLITQCVAEDWYKIIAESLRVLGVITTVVRPIDLTTEMFVGGYDFSPFVTPMYNSILPRLEAHDIDQEIKECAITAMGKLLTHMGDHLQDRVPLVLGLLMDRLRNEITRMSTLRTFAMIASSPLRLDMTPILSQATGDLAQFLRQQSRILKQTTLQTLEALIAANSAHMPPALVATVLQETSYLINDTDLHLTHLALKVTLSVLQKFPSATGTVRTDVVPRALNLAASPLLQGQALSSLIALFQELTDTSAMSLDALLNALLSKTVERAELPKQSVSNLAKCIAGLSVRAEPTRRDAIVAVFVNDLQSDDDRRKQLALLCIGELGQQVDLSSAPELKDMILSCFESNSEETKTAAAYALGHLAVGNMPNFLPVVLQAVCSNRHQYLLLASLKEIIVVHANFGQDFSFYLDQVLPGLIEQCRSDEQGVRNMVAECLGALATIHSERIIPTLQQLGAAGADANTRWTVATALRFSLSRQAPVHMLRDSMQDFLGVLRDEDLDVRRAGLLMVNAAVHHHPELIRQHLQEVVVPVLLETMDLKLQREVDLGPFKHKVDDGLPLRKAALACIDTILDTLPERLDVGAFMPYLAKGLADHEELRLLSQQVLIKICSLAPGAVLGSVDRLAGPLEKTVTQKVKEAQVGTEVERANELVRSGLRAILAVNAVDDVCMNRAWIELMERLMKRENLVEMLEALRKERGLDC